ncbi:MAG: hypothetical protein OXU98_06210 [Gammaproteobacteria bacterium]|nr:hypothetical protein [Gammaproteobacteria bacterium]
MQRFADESAVQNHAGFGDCDGDGDGDGGGDGDGDDAGRRGARPGRDWRPWTPWPPAQSRPDKRAFTAVGLL